MHVTGRQPICPRLEVKHWCPGRPHCLLLLLQLLLLRLKRQRLGLPGREAHAGKGVHACMAGGLYCRAGSACRAHMAWSRAEPPPPLLRPPLLLLLLLLLELLLLREADGDQGRDQLDSLEEQLLLLLLLLLGWRQWLGAPSPLQLRHRHHMVCSG